MRFFCKFFSFCERYSFSFERWMCDDNEMPVTTVNELPETSVDEMENV